MPNPAFRLVALVSLSVLLIFFLACSRPPDVSDLRLVEVGPFSATLEWSTGSATACRILYGEGALFDRELVEEKPSVRHRATLTGLKPATRYAYRFDPGGAAAAFRTAPGRDGAFDLVVLDPASPLCRREGPEAAAGFEADPDIVVLTGPCSGGLGGRPESILTVETPESGAKTLRYGRYVILVSRDVSTAAGEATRPEDAERSKIVVVSRAPGIVPGILEQAVILSPRAARFAGGTTTWGADLAAWFEVDAFEIAWVHGGAEDRQRRVIVEAPPETKKTCLYCSRLMESGRYEESVAWYRAFISGNKDRYAVEDAAFSIARILEEKLFRYPAAIEAYREFLGLYPQSRRASLARYRLEYLLARSDHDFEPLARFERARADLVAADPLPAVNEVESVLADFPDAAVAEDALFWLGHLLEGLDPERARICYGALLDRFPGSENAALASIALGDIDYRAKRYRRAILAYETALKIVPEKYRISVLDKIRKSRRNVKREVARYAAWLTLVAWLAVTIGLRAQPSGKELRAASIVLAAYAFGGGLYLAITYEKSRVLLPMLSVLAATMGGVFLWNRTLSRGSRSRPWMWMAHAVMASVCVVYLVLYRFHYLYVLGL